MKYLVCVKRGQRRDDPVEFYEFTSERAAVRFARVMDNQGYITAITEV